MNVFELSKLHGCRFILFPAANEYEIRELDGFIPIGNETAPDFPEKIQSKCIGKIGDDYIFISDFIPLDSVRFCETGEEILQNIMRAK